MEGKIDKTSHKHFYGKALRRSLILSVPGSRRKCYTEYHLRHWRRKCYGLRRLGIDYGVPCLEKYAKFGHRRSRCLPIGLNSVRHLLPNLKCNPEESFTCGQHWVCPWCSARRGTRPFLRLRRYLFDLLPSISLAGYSWLCVTAAWVVDKSIKLADTANMVDFYRRTVEWRGKTLHKIRIGDHSLAAGSRMMFVPGFKGDRDTNLSFLFRMAVLTKPSKVFARRVVEQISGLHGEPYRIQSSEYPADQMIAAAGVINVYPRSLLYADVSDLSHLVRLKHAMPGKCITVASTVNRLALVKLGLTPETEMIPDPPE